MKRPGKRDGKEQEIELLNALKFISVAQNINGKAPYQRHCAFRDNDVIAFDGILTAGYPVVESLSGCPDTFKLIAALSQVRGQYSMVLLDSLQLSIRSDVFNALVPTIQAEMIDHVRPDGPERYAIGNEFKDGCALAAIYCTDAGETIVSSAIVTQSASVMGTNGSTGFVEASTGWLLPAGLVLPNNFVKAIKKTHLNLTHFAFSAGSFTAFFEGGAWIKTQVYQETYPKLDKVVTALNEATPTIIPPGFWSAVEAVAPHTENGTIYVTNNYVTSHRVAGVGAQHECDGLPFTCAFPLNAMAKMKAIMTKADFTTSPNFIVLYGDNVRGLIAKHVL